MKTKFLSIMVLAACMMMAACGDNQKKNDQTAEDESGEKVMTAEDATADAEAVVDEEDYEIPHRGIETIRKVWADKSLTVDGDKSKVGIKELMKAFSGAYPQCETNEALRRYFADKDAAGKDEFSLEIEQKESNYPTRYDITCNARNGFIRSMGWVETDRFTYGCFWNRKNGHKLFAAYMDECWESASWDQCLVVFYDYDPATGTMTPEPELTNMIEKRAKGYTCYYLDLPEEGKDIQMTVVDDHGNDMDEDWTEESFVLKWDGQSFGWK